jgi:uncharacterized membrane protein HdeD (DUF308 family)
MAAHRPFAEADAGAWEVGLGPLIYGLFLVPIGLVALSVPSATAPGAGLRLGAVLLLAGSSGVATLSFNRKAAAFWPHLAWALIAAAAGAVALLLPRLPGLSLTMVLGLACLAQGGAAVVYAVEHWRRREVGWAGMLLGGGGTAVLGGLLMAGDPLARILTGAAVAFNVATFGVSVAASAFYRRRRTG